MKNKYGVWRTRILSLRSRSFAGGTKPTLGHLLNIEIRRAVSYGAQKVLDEAFRAIVTIDLCAYMRDCLYRRVKRVYGYIRIAATPRPTNRNIFWSYHCKTLRLIVVSLWSSVTVRFPVLCTFSGSKEAYSTWTPHEISLTRDSFSKKFANAERSVK